MPFPRNHSSIANEAGRARAHFAGRLGEPCWLIGTGDPAALAEGPGAIFRTGDLPARRPGQGAELAGHFSAGADAGLDARLAALARDGSWRIGAYFRPELAASADGVRAAPDPRLTPSFDPWALIAAEPTLARFLMGRPQPGLELQALACLAALGFRDIRMRGFDPLRAAPGHSRDLDLMFLRAIRAAFDVRLRGIARLATLAPVPVPAPVAGTPPPAGRLAYATLVVGDYVLGACALARSLARVSDLPLVAMYHDPATGQRLARLPNVIPRAIEPIDNPNLHGPRRLGATYSKLRVFDMLDYERVVFIDADCVALRTPDPLFATTGFCAAPNWGIGLSMRTFNSGVFAFSPSAELRDRIQGNITRLPSNTGGDQGYLNALLEKEWTPLPPEFNTLKRQLVLHPNLVSLSDVRILHFVGSKPWSIDQPHGDYAALTREWLRFLEPEDWSDLFWISNRRITRQARLARRAQPAKAPLHRRLIPALRARLRRLGLS